MPTAHLDLARRLAGLFASLPEVEAVALGGSRGGGGQWSIGSSGGASRSPVFRLVYQ